MTIEQAEGIDFFNHPPQATDDQVGGRHYLNYAIQPFEFCRANSIPHAEGEIIYHVLRHRQKSGEEDLRKAIHVIEMIIAADYSPKEE